MINPNQTSWEEWAARHAKGPIVIERWKDSGMWNMHCGDLTSQGFNFDGTLAVMLRLVATGHLEPQ